MFWEGQNGKGEGRDLGKESGRRQEEREEMETQEAQGGHLGMRERVTEEEEEER